MAPYIAKSGRSPCARRSANSAAAASCRLRGQGLRAQHACVS